jgi:hypothetical protein
MAEDRKAIVLAVDAATAPLMAEKKNLKNELTETKKKAPMMPAPVSLVVGPASAYATGAADGYRADSDNPLLVTTATGVGAAAASVGFAIAGMPTLAQASADMGNANLSVLTHEAGKKKGAAMKLRAMAKRADDKK